MSRRLTTEEFVSISKKIHEDKYNYSKVVYESANKKVTIICSAHGEYQQSPFLHKKGHGCPKCAVEVNTERSRWTTEIAIREFKRVHGDKYDYSKVDYISANEKVIVICPAHGEFYPSTWNHKKGSGCPKCGDATVSVKNTSNKEDFAFKADKIHSGAYSYGKVSYVSAIDQVEITCPIHGPFILTPNVHLNGTGCPDCTKEYTSYKASVEGQKTFAERSSLIHNNKYNYSLSNYINYDMPVKIICPIHGVFKQTPDKHLQGCGCQKCGVHLSKREDDLADFLEEVFEVVRRDRKTLGKKELDIFIPSKKIAIEYNGSLFHSEFYKTNAKWHLKEKQDMCSGLGIRLIHVSDYEDQYVIKHTLSHILGMDDTRVFARTCRCEPVNSIIAQYFLDKFHLQGNVTGCKYWGIFHNKELMGVVAFSKISSHRGLSDPSNWELRRLAFKNRVVGGAGKLLKAFIRATPECKLVTSYSDNRWFTGGVYEKLGFKLVKDCPPDYKYVSRKGNGRVFHKSGFRLKRMSRKHGITFDPALTELENTKNNDYHRIWDCGKKKWELSL